MAGLAGIVFKHSNKNREASKSSFQKMMKSLVFDNAQHSEEYADNNVLLGMAIPISQSLNNNFIINNTLGVFVFVEGNVYVSDYEKDIIRKSHNIDAVSSSNQLLPFLYQTYKKDIVDHISGWYNVVIYDQKKNTVLIFNDKLGFLPIYYYENESVFVFSSKIESIIESGFVSKIEFDEVSFLEFVFFNYTISEHTFIKEISTISDALIIEIENGKSNIKQYWDINFFFNKPKLNKKQSVDAFDEGLKKAIEKFIQNHNGIFNFSLTGGWDSRVVLSYLLNHEKNNIFSYSFGASYADDILIPTKIADFFKIKYQSFVLDENYLNHHFLPNALDTIMLSGGTRSYKRTHYLYAIKNVAKHSDIVLTGIFGDEVFKSGKPTAGAVISQHGIDLIDSKVSVDSIMSNIFKESFAIDFDTDKKAIMDELRLRIAKVKSTLADYDSDGERHFAFRFKINLRKYFGNEVNSYNDFTNHFSPYTDIDFLETFATTKYMISRYEYRDSTLFEKAESSDLYYQIVKRNCPELLQFNSSRGFSMKDIKTITGLVRVFQSKFLQKPRVDAFNTSKTRSKFFHEILEKTAKEDVIKGLLLSSGKYDMDSYYSILYWINSKLKH